MTRSSASELVGGYLLRLSALLLAAGFLALAPGAQQKTKEEIRAEIQAKQKALMGQVFFESLDRVANEFRKAREQLDAAANPGEERAAQALLVRLESQREAMVQDMALAVYYAILWELDNLTLEPEEKVQRLEVLVQGALMSATRPGYRDSMTTIAATEEVRLGLLLLDLGRIEEARRWLERAVGHDPTVRNQMALAEFELRRGRFGVCWEILERVEASGSQEVLDPDRAQVALMRVRVCMDLGLPDLAARELGPLQEALRSSESGTADPRLREIRSQAEEREVQLLRAQGRHPEAVERAGEFLADDKAYPPGPRRARMLVMRGWSRFALELEDPALEPLGLAWIEAALPEAGPIDRCYGLQALAEAELRAGNFERCQARLEEARAAQSSASSVRPDLEPDLLLARLALARGDSRELLARHEERLAEQLDELLRQWDSAPALTEGVGFFLFPMRRAILGGLTRLGIALDPTGGVERSLERILEYESRSTLSRGADPAPVALQDVRRELLEPGHGILLYLPATGTSHVFAIDAGGVTHAELADSDVLERVVERVLKHLRTGATALAAGEDPAWLVEEEQALARRASDALLPADIRTRISGWTRLSLVGADTLGPVPLEWLPCDETPWLGTRLAIDYLPSMRLGVQWSRALVAHRLDRDLLVVGDVEPGDAARALWPNTPRIPLDGAFESDLADALGASRALTLRGASATVSGLGEALQTSSGVLQFIVHGVREPAGAVLPLLAPSDSEPGILRRADVAGFVAPRLVVQSYCQSAQAPRRRGDPGVNEIGAAWLERGAQAVVVTPVDLTLGEVRRDSPVLLSLLRSGASPAEALRLLRVARVERAGERAPLEGGLWQVQGLGHRPLYAPEELAPLDGRPSEAGIGERKRTALLAFAAGALTALGFAVLWRRRSA